MCRSNLDYTITITVIDATYGGEKAKAIMDVYVYEYSQFVQRQVLRYLEDHYGRLTFNLKDFTAIEVETSVTRNPMDQGFWDNITWSLRRSMHILLEDIDKQAHLFAEWERENAPRLEVAADGS